MIIVERNKLIRKDVVEKTELLKKEVGQVSVQLSRMHVRDVVSRSLVVVDDTIDTLTKSAIKDNVSLQVAAKMAGVDNAILENEDMVVKESVKAGNRRVYASHALEVKEMIEVNELYKESKMDRNIWVNAIKFLCEHCPSGCRDVANKILLLLSDPQGSMNDVTMDGE
jgi:hypothetical protein